MHKYPGQAWKFVVHHGSYMKLKKFDILSNDMSCSTTLLISSELVVDFYNISKFVGQVILEKKVIVLSLLCLLWHLIKHRGIIHSIKNFRGFLSSCYITWLRADPCMTTAGLTASGGTGNTVTIIHSGRANLGSMPKMMSSSSEMRLKISCTRSGLSSIFFSCESSLTCFHSAYSSKPERLIRGW